jgi:beta-carotene 15,15'-monooxygenase
VNREDRANGAPPTDDRVPTIGPGVGRRSERASVENPAGEGDATAELGFHSLPPTVEGRADVSLAGSLPEWLSGVLVRNGPGTFEAGDGTVDHWFDGLAMLHRIGLDGAADRVTYRSRFLRSDAYWRARTGRPAGGFATGESTLRERVVGALAGGTYDNANVICERVGDRYLALTETPRWVAVDPRTLATLGSVEHEGPLVGQTTCAHFGRDGSDTPVTFDVDFGRTSRYHVYELADAATRRPIASLAVDRPAYMHSFALTPSYVLLTEFPFTVDPMTFLTPGRQGPFVEAYEWDPDRGTRILVVDRATGELVAAPRTDATFGFHHVNAYEDGRDVVFDLETVPDAEAVGALSLTRLRAGQLDAFAGRIDRYRVVDPAGAGAATVERTRLYGDGTALPRVSPARRGRRHRYVYAQSTGQPVTEWPTGVLKLDVETGDVREFTVDGWQFSEPVFVPRPAAARTAEDDGVVLTVALDNGGGRSVVVVLDGGSFTELARAPLPHAVPFGFHGRWFPDLSP